LEPTPESAPADKGIADYANRSQTFRPALSHGALLSQLSLLSAFRPWFCADGSCFGQSINTQKCQTGEALLDTSAAFSVV